MDDWRVDRSKVQRAVEYMFENYDVVYLYADPWRWRDELEEWGCPLARPDHRSTDELGQADARGC